MAEISGFTPISPSRRRSTNPRSVPGAAVRPFGRARIAAGMEGEHGLAARQQSTEQSQSEQAAGEIAAEVQVQNVGLQALQQPHQGGGALRVIHAIGILAAEARQVDGVALVPVAAQIFADGDQVGLHAAVRRRIRTKLHHPHSGLAASIATGAPSRAEAIMARQPSVARAPSCTVTAGARPCRMLSAKSAICAP